MKKINHCLIWCKFVCYYQLTNLINDLIRHQTFVVIYKVAILLAHGEENSGRLFRQLEVLNGFVAVHLKISVLQKFS